MLRTAKVTRLIGAGKAEVLVERLQTCGQDCAACGGCARPNELITVTAYNKTHAQVGDTVVIESDSRNTLRLAAIVYLLPVLLFLVGWFVMPIVGAMGALAGLGVTFWANSRLRRKGGLSISIVEVVGPDR